MNHNPIAIDGRGAIFYRGTGIGTYTWQLLAHLQSEIEDLDIFLPGREYEGLSFSPTNTPVFTDIWREEFLPKTIQEKKIGLYHVPQNGIGLPYKKCCKESVTIHDLIPYIYPETVGKGYLKEFLKEMPDIMERADGIITVSRCSADDIRKIFGYPKEKIRIIHEAPEPIYRPIKKEDARSYLKTNYHIRHPFILYVGGYGIRKNVKALINAFYLLKKEENYPYQLVLPGKRNRDFDALDQIIEILKLQDDVVFTDHIPVSEMPYFYNAAEIMVYPSIYEGFGLPPLEAMACGTPVIAAKTSSLPEILGDAVLWFDPFHTINLAEQMHRLTASKTLQDLYRQKGLQKAQTYSWEKTAQETASYFREILTVHS